MFKGYLNLMSRCSQSQGFFYSFRASEKIFFAELSQWEKRPLKNPDDLKLTGAMRAKIRPHLTKEVEHEARKNGRG